MKVVRTLQLTRNSYSSFGYSQFSPLRLRTAAREAIFPVARNSRTFHCHSNIVKETSRFGLAISILSGLFFTAVGARFILDKRPLRLDTPSVTKPYPDINMPSELPGRPGTLTPEQELKLKEFWLLVFEVFGVIRPVSKQAESSSVSTHSEAVENKKKRHWFSRSKDVDESSSSTTSDGKAGGVNATIDSIDDKHNQVKEFRQALASQTPEQLRATFWLMVKHDNPDALVLRFLRARKWNPHDALVMLISTLHWRSVDMKLDEEIMFKGENGFIQEAMNGEVNSASRKDAEGLIAQLRTGRTVIRGLDKENRPISVVIAKLHKPGAQSERSLEICTVYLLETTRMLLRPGVDTATIIFDLGGFSLSNMDYTPVKFIIKCFEANYPECLGAVLVYRAPWVFQGIWKIIKGWLDPVVASKIHFCSNEDDLAVYVDKSKILKSLGGNDDWEYKYLEPNPEEDARMKDVTTREEIQRQRNSTAETFEKLTLAWARNEHVDMTEREKVTTELSDNYWKLDPYIRGRSLCDRIGMIRGGGQVDFYPSYSDITS